MYSRKGFTCSTLHIKRCLREQHGEALQAFLNNESNHNDEEPKEETNNDTPQQQDALDPLTAMVREQEAQEKRRQELDLKYRKERARRKRGIQEGEATEAHGEDYSVRV